MASTLTNQLTHVVFSTKNREPTISSAVSAQLYSYIGGIIRGEGASLLSIGGTSNHVHILLRLPAAMALAEITRKIKANSSRWMNERQSSRFSWQRGYAAFSVSQSMIDRVSTYIQNQMEHHQTTSFEDEYIELLKKHGIEYDARFVFAE